MIETKNPMRIINAMNRWLTTSEYKPLILSREPYKQYYVKRTGDFSPAIYPNCIIADLQFLAIDSYAYSVFKTGDIDEFMYYDEKNASSGLMKSAQYKFENPQINKAFNIYHGGNSDHCYPVIKIKGTFTSLVIENKTTGEKCILDYVADKDEIIVDCARKIVLFNGIYSVVGHNQDFISLKGKNDLFYELVGEQENGMNEIYISSPNHYDIEEIFFDFRYVYY